MHVVLLRIVVSVKGYNDIIGYCINKWLFLDEIIQGLAHHLSREKIIYDYNCFFFFGYYKDSPKTTKDCFHHMQQYFLHPPQVDLG